MNLNETFVSAGLDIAPRLRRANGCALKLSGVQLIAEDSGQPVTKLKSLELVMCSTFAAMLVMKARGVMVVVCPCR